MARAGLYAVLSSGALAGEDASPMAAMPRSERTAARQAAFKRGLALPPASPGAAPGFPVADSDHWDKARRAVGRVKDPARRAALAKLLRKTAPRFGKEHALRQSWAAPGGSSHANGSTGIQLAMRAKLDNGQMLTCPECGHVAPSGHFGASGASLQKQPGLLRTPAQADVRGRAGFAPGSSGIQPKAGKAAHALANSGEATELAGTLTSRRFPVSSPVDVIVARGDDGTARIRHRQGGSEIAQIRKNDDGTWTAVMGGKDLAPHTHQRAALMEAVGTWNKSLSGLRPASAPLQPPAQQTPLMAEYGIPAIRALATPMTSSGSGPRMTTAGKTGRWDPDKDGDNDADPADDKDRDYAGALSPKGRAIYKRLCAKGMTPARALAFAKRAESMNGAKAA